MTKLRLKRSLSLALVITAIASMTVLTWGCGADNKKTEKNPQVLDIMSEIKKTMDISSSNIEASEVGIIKVKDASAANGIKDKIEKRIQQQSSSFKDYLPDEYELLQNHVLKVKDKYIFYVVSKDADKIENTFDGFFK